VWLLADWSLRWAVLIALLALWLGVARPRRAAVRSLVCWGVLVAGLLLPFLPRWGPAWTTLPSEQSTQLAPQPTSVEPGEDSALPKIKEPALPEVREAIPPRPTQNADRPSSHEDSTQGAGLASASEPLNVKGIILCSIAIVWTAVVCLLVVRCLGGWFLLERLRRTAVPLDGSAVEVFTACRAELGMRRRVTLAAHPLIRSPLTLGLGRPTILVSPSWSELPPQDQRGSLLHELAHLARHDDWSALLLELLRILFFFHPLLHWLLRRIECERELLCDETVLARGINPRDYARMLLEFSRLGGRLVPAVWAAPSFMVQFGKRRTMKIRIKQLLEDNMPGSKSRLSLWRTLSLATGVIGVALLVGCVRIGADEAERQPGQATQAESKERQDTEKTPPRSKKAREALHYGGKHFTDWCDTLTNDLKPEVRAEAIKALSRFAVNGYGREAAEAIVEAMRGYDVVNRDQEDDLVIRAAMAGLSKIPEEAVSVLREELKHGPRNGRRFACFALVDNDNVGAPGSGRTVPALGTEAKAAVPELIAAFQDKDPHVRRMAIHACRVLDLQAKGLVPALIGALSDKDAFVRRNAMWTLGATGTKDQSAIPALLKNLQDSDHGMRGQAIRTLRAIKAPAKTVVPVLIKILNNDLDNVQLEAVDSLAAKGPEAKEAVPDLIIYLKSNLKSRNSSAVIGALRCLSAIGPGAKEALPLLTEMLKLGGAWDNNVYIHTSEALNSIKK
jgi:beta-lactamase regulating signal transducer with metallopeptidase domain/HEAT repeat protein